MMKAPSLTQRALPPTTVRAEMMLLIQIMLPAVAPTACSASSAVVVKLIDSAATCTCLPFLKLLQSMRARRHDNGELSMFLKLQPIQPYMRDRPHEEGIRHTISAMASQLKASYWWYIGILIEHHSSREIWPDARFNSCLLGKDCVQETEKREHYCQLSMLCQRTLCTMPKVRLETVVEPEKNEPSAPRAAANTTKPPLSASAML